MIHHDEQRRCPVDRNGQAASKEHRHEPPAFRRGEYVNAAKWINQRTKRKSRPGGRQEIIHLNNFLIHLFNLMKIPDKDPIIADNNTRMTNNVTKQKSIAQTVLTVLWNTSVTTYEYIELKISNITSTSRKDSKYG